MFKLMEGRQYDLEDRLVLFGVNIIKLCEGLPPIRGTSHLGGQLILIFSKSVKTAQEKEK